MKVVRVVDVFVNNNIFATFNAQLTR